MDILNSEGCILGIETLHNNLYLKIKKQANNSYAYFPTDRNSIEQYLAGNITTRELLIPLEDFVFINNTYTSIPDGLKTSMSDDILAKI